MKQKNQLGDRMKRYEKATHHHLTKKVPVIIRCDGRAFHTFTKNLQKPFDPSFSVSLLFAANSAAKQMMGFKLAYVQSDEVSFLLTDFNTVKTEPWMGYDLSKMVSLAASIVSVWFNFNLAKLQINPGDGGSFDARAFNIPKDEVANYFLWRAKDWERNSLMMYARSFFSHEELQGKSREQIHEMLHGKGHNWSKDLQSHNKNGIFVIGDSPEFSYSSTTLPKFDAINDLVQPLLKPKEESDGKRSPVSDVQGAAPDGGGNDRGGGEKKSEAAPDQGVRGEPEQASPVQGSSGEGGSGSPAGGQVHEGREINDPSTPGQT